LPETFQQELEVISGEEVLATPVPVPTDSR
jgi:hypothetical protein